jgi:Spy/CpxP family protein refolding chaperone
MKKVLTGFAVTFVAAVWMVGSWFFFNSIAAGAQGTNTPSVGNVEKSAPHDRDAEGGCGCGGHWKHHRGHHSFWKKLNLTDPQKKEMFSIKLEERAKMKPLIEKLKAGRDQLRTLGMNAQFDEAKVQAAAKGQSDIITQLIVEKVRMKSRMFAVLTPEQRAKAEQMRETCKAHHEKGPKHED